MTEAMDRNDEFFGLEAFGLQLCFDTKGRAPGFAGGAWRGMMGRALSAAVCVLPAPLCATCPTATVCTYPRLFKPIPETALPPFWLHGWQRDRNGWRVGIRWLGRDHHYAITEWLDALARDTAGLTFGGAPVRLRRRHLAPPAIQPTALPLAPSCPPPDQCHIQFVTPLVSKHTGDPLFGALHTRVQRLVQQHGNGAVLPRPQQPWRCRVLAQHVQRVPLAQRMLTGTRWALELRDIDADAWALLHAGLELHAGGQATMGCGHYEIQRIDSPPMARQ